MFKNFTLWQAIKIGGPVMYVLILCSILSIAIIVERIMYYRRRSRVARVDFMKSIRHELEKGETEKAERIAEQAGTPFAAVVLAGINSHDRGDKDITHALERQVIMEANELEKRTAIVGTIGSTAVYIGLLGTVWGIIRTFKDISQAGSGEMGVIIGGISEALICTAAGLAVAIPAVMAYNYFVKKISSFVTDMELCASETADLLKSSGRSR